MNNIIMVETAISVSTTEPMDKVDVKYSEYQIYSEALTHALSTYKSHYASEIEPLEFIFEKDLDVNFFINSALTYQARYGKKKGHNERDLLKAIHFLVIAVHYTRELKKRGLINETK